MARWSMPPGRRWPAGSQLVGGLITLVGLFGHAARDDLIESDGYVGSVLTWPRRVQRQVPGDLLLDAVREDRA